MKSHAIQYTKDTLTKYLWAEGLNVTEKDYLVVDAADPFICGQVIAIFYSKTEAEDYAEFRNFKEMMKR